MFSEHGRGELCSPAGDRRSPLLAIRMTEKQDFVGDESYMKVNFYEQVDDKLLKFAVIISKHNGQWVFCKHKDRSTYEIPGGHRESNEEIIQTAKRELYEETGALQFDIFPICVYSVTGKNRVNQTGEETYGMLFIANIQSFENELHSEMESVSFFNDLPTEWTYPLIQPLLIQEYLRRTNTK